MDQRRPQSIRIVPFNSWISPHQITRRDVLTASASMLFGASFSSRLFATNEGLSTEQIAPLNRFPRMMQDYFSRQYATAKTIGLQRSAAIHSKADAIAFVATVRTLIQDCFGPFPDRTPLNPKVTRVVERDTYRIENVIFESRPGFLVTANLYVPLRRALPLPTVIATCGHSTNGKAAEPYQAFAQGLARIGYVVLIFDPIGQGERLQYPDALLKSKIGVGVPEHLHAGNQQFLVGEFFGSWLAWDAMRGVDYLLTRPEVDPNQLGVTGNSGGGTQAMWLCGLERRLTMAAPSCAVTTFRHNFSNELPTDTEQCPPLALKYGLDHADFLAAMAPKPVMIIAAEKDYFDVRGSIETYERLRPIYRWLGAEDNIRLFIGPNEHGYTQPNREAMYSFFNEQAKREPVQKEPSLTFEKDETLQCAPRGQVALLDSKTVMVFTRKMAQQQTQQRSKLTADELRRRVTELIPIRPDTLCEYEILRPTANRRYPKPHATTYALETEPGIRAIATRLGDKQQYSRPASSAGRVLIYVSHQSSDAELRDNPFIQELIEGEPTSEFFAIDVRGIGESQPQTCGENQFLEPYGSDYFYAAHSIMLGISYPAQRAFDLLRVIDWIAAQGRTEIHLAAYGWGTVPATLAAVASPHVIQVTLKQRLKSFTELAESETYDWPLSSLIPGVIKKFDLPDCYEFLATKKLKVID